MARSNIGSPYRMLDQTQITTRANNTYNVLSGLAKTAGEAFSVVKSNREQKMARRAKNDVVNDTINRDLAYHSESYANVVVQSEAEKSWTKMASRIKAGEFDNASPEAYQAMLNKEHEQVSARYAGSKYYDSIMDTYNSFWLENEVKLTTTQSAKHRVKLKSAQSDALVQDMARKMAMPGATKQDVLDTVSDPAYSMLEADDRTSAALEVTTLLARQGMTDAIAELDDTFGFSSNPDYAKHYSVAEKEAIKVKQTRDTDTALKLRKQYDESVANGTLGQATWETVKNLTGPDGRPIVGYKEFSADLLKSKANLIKNKNKMDAAKAALTGIDISDMAKAEDYQGIHSKNIGEILSSNDSAYDAGVKVGKYIEPQRKTINMVSSLGNAFSSYDPTISDGTPNPAMTEAFNMLHGMRTGMKNDVKFFKAIGDTGTARFKMYEREYNYAIGTAEQKAQAASKAVEMAEKRLREGTNPKMKFIPQGLREFRQEQTQEYLERNDSWYWLDDTRDASTQATEFMNSVDAQVLHLVNNRGLPMDEATVQTAIDQTSAVFVEFNGSLSPTWGAEYDFEDDLKNVEQTLMRSVSIRSVLADHQGVKVPSWDDARMKLDYESESVVILDRENTLVLRVPFADAVQMNKARNNGIMSDAEIARLYSDEVQATRAGREAKVVQQLANEQFFIDQVSDPNTAGETPKPEVWDQLSEEGKTQARMQYWKDNVLTIDSAIRSLGQLSAGNTAGIKMLAKAGVDKFNEIWNKVKDAPKASKRPGMPGVRPTNVEVRPDIGVSAAEAAIPQDTLITDVTKDIKAHEGASGDTTGAAVTGKFGMTKARKDIIKRQTKNPNITDEEAITYYVNQLNTTWSKKPGWDKASPELQKALINIAYNQGGGIANYKDLSNALAKLRSGGDEEAVIRTMLRRATSDGKALRGIAKRYAELHNSVTNEHINWIRQDNDGTLWYVKDFGKGNWRDEDNVVMKFKPSKGRHPDSKPGWLKVKG